MPHAWMIWLTVVELALNSACLAGATCLAIRHRRGPGFSNLLILCLMFVCMTTTNAQWCLQVVSGSPPGRWFYIVGKICAPLDYMLFAVFIWRRSFNDVRWSMGRLLSLLLPFACCFAVIVNYTVVPYQALIAPDLFSRSINIVIWPAAAFLMSLLLHFSQQTMRAIDTVFLLSMMLILTCAVAGEHELITTGYSSVSWSQLGWVGGFAGLAGCVLADVRSTQPVLHLPAERAEWFSLRALIGVAVFASNMALLAALTWAGLLSISNGQDLTYALLLGYASWCASIVIAIALSRRIRNIRAFMADSTLRHATGVAALQRAPRRTRLAEVDSIIDGYNEHVTYINDLDRVLIEKEKQAALGHAARQVAHDIRSPLAALKMALPYITDVEEDIRVLMRDAVHRVEDIANDLLEHHRREKPVQDEVRVLVSAAVEQLVSALRLAHRSRLGLTFQSDIDDDAHFLFAAAPPVDIKRVVSNLANNAAEAIGDSGLVSVEVRCGRGTLQIAVKDTGQGMSPETLSRLGEEGMTLGKKDGNGLGVFQARREVVARGGTLVYESELGRGTTATITLPQATAPDWLLKQLSLLNGQRIIVLDDDVSIHRVWRERFGEAAPFTSCSTVQDFQAAVQTLPPNHQAVYLVDHELNGSPMNGLQAIDALKIKGAILVTSNYEDPQIIAACEKAGVKVLPKFLAARVPIVREDSVCVREARAAG